MFGKRGVEGCEGVQQALTPNRRKKGRTDAGLREAAARFRFHGDVRRQQICRSPAVMPETHNRCRIKAHSFQAGLKSQLHHDPTYCAVVLFLLGFDAVPRIKNLLGCELLILTHKITASLKAVGCEYREGGCYCMSELNSIATAHHF